MEIFAISPSSSKSSAPFFIVVLDPLIHKVPAERFWRLGEVLIGAARWDRVCILRSDDIFNFRQFVPDTPAHEPVRLYLTDQLGDKDKDRALQTQWQMSPLWSALVPPVLVTELAAAVYSHAALAQLSCGLGIVYLPIGEWDNAECWEAVRGVLSAWSGLSLQAHFATPVTHPQARAHANIFV